MYYFPELKTKDLTINIDEITIGDSLKIAKIPVSRYEKITGEFIEKVAKINKPFNELSVCERLLIIAHYEASTNETPDFQIGELHYSDYFFAEKTAESNVNIGTLFGKEFAINPLMGYMSEAIEDLLGVIEGISPHFHWVVGTLSAQLIIDGEELSDSDEYESELFARMKDIIDYKESDFISLLVAFNENKHRVNSFFNIDVNSDGIIVLPIDNKELDSDLMLPARFSVFSVISEFTKIMAR